jgi:hypothetical protein
MHEKHVVEVSLAEAKIEQPLGIDAQLATRNVLTQHKVWNLLTGEDFRYSDSPREFGQSQRGCVVERGHVKAKYPVECLLVLRSLSQHGRHVQNSPRLVVQPKYCD